MFSEEVQTLLAQIRQKHGANSVVTGGDLAQPQRRRIPFGVFTLDAATGGGIPKGRVTLLIGDQSAAKTTLAIMACAKAQRLCRFCQMPFKYTVNDDTTITVVKPCECGKSTPHVAVYADIEGTLDLTYARQLGFNPDIALVLQPDYAEQGIDIVDAMVRSGEADIVVVDSIAELTPTTEIEESADNWQQGLGARLVNKFCRKLASALNSLGATNEQKPAILFINQKREKIGVLYGDPTTIPYGRGQKFIASMTLDLRAGKAIRLDPDGKEVEQKGEPVGATIYWKIVKSKVSQSTQGKSGEFKLYTITAPRFGVKTGMVNNVEQILTYAVLLGLVEKTRQGMYTYGKVKARGQAAFVKALREAKVWQALKREAATAYAAQALTSEVEE